MGASSAGHGLKAAAPGLVRGRCGAALCCKLLLHTLQAAGAAELLPRLTHTHLEKEAPAESADEYGCLNPHDGSG